MSRYMTLLDWLKLLEDLRVRGVKILHKTAFEAFYGGKNRSLNVILSRLERRGVIKRVAKGWYVIAPCEIWEIISVVFPSAYISLEWALHYHEIIDQKINIVTLVWLGKTKTVKTRHYTFELHKISKNLHFGFDERLIAKPEKALLDTAYIRKSLPPELNEDLLDRRKLMGFAVKFPKYVIRILKSRGLI
mgnify:CR=1 FL=1